MIAKLGINFQNPPIEVSHFTLDGAGRPNQWKSECPVCGTGLLLVNRNSETLAIESYDCCTFCGQHFLYTDVEDMQRKDGIANGS